MACTIRRVDYFHTTVRDQPGEAYKVLTTLQELGINLLAFTAVPIGSDVTQLTIFPEDSHLLLHQANDTGLKLDGPHPALLVQGDDELGALATIHRDLYQANINVSASSGVTDGQGSFGYVIYVRPEDFDRAVGAIGPCS
ncbi:MAG: hypothetical protein P8130_14195 [Deltaproteobacteria bacterium]